MLSRISESKFPDSVILVENQLRMDKYINLNKDVRTENLDDYSGCSYKDIRNSWKREVNKR